MNMAYASSIKFRTKTKEQAVKDDKAFNKAIRHTKRQKDIGVLIKEGRKAGDEFEANLAQYKARKEAGTLKSENEALEEELKKRAKKAAKRASKNKTN